MYVLRSGAFMQTDKKIDLVRQLLLAFGVRNNETGIQWAKAFNREEGLRRQLDPSGQLYDRKRVMRVGTQRKLQALPNAEGLTVEKIEELVTVIAPRAVSRFDGVAEKNVKGAYRALAHVTRKYPEVSYWLRQYGSVKGQAAIGREKALEVQPSIEEGEELAECKKEMDAWRERERDRWGGYWIGQSADSVAKQYKVSSRAPVKKWLKENGAFARATSEFYEIVLDLTVEKTVKDCAKKLAQRAVNFYVPKDSGYYACASSVGGVWIGNKLGTQDYDEEMRVNVEQNWHPPFDEEFGGAMSVMVHELGHVLDYMTGARDDPEILKIWRSKSIDKGKEISRYAKENCAEMIAEAFAEYHTSKSPRPLACRIAKRVDQLYTEKYGAPFGQGDL